jgi:SpoVK/Ycf46/Vps4 family AAA+-type ATPase
MAETVNISTAEQAFLEKLNAKLVDLTEKRTAFKGMLYGESGTGKTVLGMRLAQSITPVGKHILLVDSGQGWVSLKNHPGLLTRVHKFNISGMSEFDALCGAISREVNEFFANVGCIIIDEYSSFADYDVLAVTRARAARDRGSEKDADEPKLPDMGVSSNRMRRFTGPLVSLPNTHVIFIAHQRTDKNNMAVDVISPKFMPAFNAFIRGELHLVGRLTADEYINDEGKVAYSRKIQVNPTNRIVAKTRVGGLNTVDVDEAVLINSIKEWLEGKRETLEKDNTAFLKNAMYELAKVEGTETEDLPTDVGSIDSMDDIINSLKG